MDLFNQPALPDFDGATYSRPLDHARLSTAMGRVMELMKDGEERTLADIAHLAKCSEAGASARLRDIRKKKWQAIYGPWQMIARRLHDGQWGYQLVKP